MRFLSCPVILIPTAVLAADSILRGLTGQSTTVDLISEGPKVKDGDVVSLGFYTDIIGTQMGDSVRVAEVANTDLIEVIYGEGVIYKLYLAGRVIQFVAEFVGLILLSIGK